MQLNAVKQQHYLQASTSNITGNHPNSQTIIDTPPTITQSYTPVIKYLNNEPFFLSLTPTANFILLLQAQTGPLSTIQICCSYLLLHTEV